MPLRQPNGFRWFRGRKKERLRPDLPFNPYYERVAGRYAAAQMVLYVLLLLLVLGMTVTHASLLTYDRLYYFFSDISASLESWDAEMATDISYSVGENASFLPFRGGFAAVGTNGVTAFSETGRKLLSVNDTAKDPQAVTSGKYLLVFDRGGDSLQLYQASSRIAELHYEYTVSMSALSESGAFASVTGDSVYASVIRLYDERLTLAAELKEPTPVSAICFRASGNLFAYATVAAKGGTWTSSVSEIAIGEDTARFHVSVPGYVCGMVATADGTYLCLSDVGLYAVENGTVRSLESFAQNVLLRFDMRDGVCALLYEDGVRLYDGMQASSITWNGASEVTYFAVSGDRLYCLTDTAVFELSADGVVRWMQTPSGGAFQAVFPVGDGGLYLCRNNRTRYISWN